MLKQLWPASQIAGPGLRTRVILSLFCLLAAMALIDYLQLRASASFMAAHMYRSALLRLALLLATSGIVFLCCLTMKRWLFAAFAAVVTLSYLMNINYMLITGMFLTTETFEWLVSETAFLFAALSEFRYYFLRGALMAALVLALLVATRRLGRPAVQALLPARWWRIAAVAAPLSFLAMVGVLARMGPNPMPWESNVPVYLHAFLNRSIPNPGTVQEQAGTGGTRKIVMVVDESVRSDVFRELFSAEMVRHHATELSPARTTVPCSAGSNALIRWGANPREQAGTVVDPRANPSLFGYARAAGYTTHLFDAQTKGPPQNFMSSAERALVDDYAPVQGGIDSDAGLADRINAQLRAPGRGFVYAVKRGAHFPYETNYPENAETSNLDRSQRYRAAVAYSNKTFFDRMLAKVDMNDVFIVYTSDHGQQFDPDKSPHCNAEPSRQELEVPLWTMGNGQFARSIARASLSVPAQGAGYSSLQLFPTLTIAMGYNVKEIEQRYYYSIAQRVSEHWFLPHPYVPFPSAKGGPLQFKDYSPTL